MLPTATDAGAITYSVQRTDGSVVPLTGAPYTFDPATRTLSGSTAITATEILSYRATDTAGNIATQNLTNTVDHLGTAVIDAPSTITSIPTFTIVTASDPDTIASWSFSQFRTKSTGPLAPVVTTGTGNPPATIE